MADESDPPRKRYALKPREFETVNALPPPPPEEAPPLAPATYDPERPISVHDLHRIAANGRSPVGTKGPASKANDVHATLDLNRQRAEAAGLYQVKLTKEELRSKRARGYWLMMALVNIPCLLIAIKAGPRAPIPFVLALSGSALFSAAFSWHTWALRTER